MRLKMLEQATQMPHWVDEHESCRATLQLQAVEIESLKEQTWGFQCDNSDLAKQLKSTLKQKSKLQIHIAILEHE